MKNLIYMLALVILLPGFGKSQSDTIKDQESRTLWIKGQAVPKSIIQSTRVFREQLLKDPYRPSYHFCVPEDNGRPGDPNGAFYYNGRYHLMYLYNREGSGFAWGHISSKDLLHWRHHPDAIGPGNANDPGNSEDGVFSGGAYIDPQGKATISYWQFLKNRERSNFVNASSGIAIAESTDEHFDTWTKSPNNPVIKSTDWGITVAKDKNGQDIIYGSADPSNIWYKNGKYYMLTGNLLVLRKYGLGPDAPADSIQYQGDHLYLFVSEDMKQWKYMHEFYHSDRKWTEKTEDNMCPSFLPLPYGPEGGKMSDKHLLLFISHNKGCQYYIGNYKEDKFYPDHHGRMTWTDNAYFAPEALIDKNGRQIMWSWVFDDRPDSIKNASGWTGTYGLPRSLWLGQDGTLRMRPIKELTQLRQNPRVKNNLTIKSGAELKLDGFGDELLELEITLLPGTATQAGVMVNCSEDGREQTKIYYDANEKKLKFDGTLSSIDMGKRNIEIAPFELQKGEVLVLRVFIDKSIVEVFSNDRQAIGRSVYPKLGGTGIKLFSKGGDVKVISVKAWELMPSNPY